MPKRISTNWFNIKSQQQTAVNVARLPVIARTGPKPQGSRNNRQQDNDGNKFFVVGESVVGGEEIV